MIKRMLLIVMVLTLFMCPGLLWASEFSKNNPDGNKFEFMRSYISALGYLKSIDTRWDKKSPKKLYAGNDKAIIQGSIDYLIKDNTDLRIAKNYLLKYIASSNALMRKAADNVVVACEKEIQLNNKEKLLWQDWLAKKNAGQGNAANERIFVRKQAVYALKHKEIDRTVIEATILATNALKSALNTNEKGNKLAITRIQRKKLLEKLNSFARTDIDWGLKPGQRTVSASVAVIREILEDPVWITIDDIK